MEKDVIDNFFKDEKEVNLTTLIFLDKKLEAKQKIVNNLTFLFDKKHY